MEERIPFDIKLRPEIEAGKFLIETRDGTPARIICWDRRGYYHIIALLGGEIEVGFAYTEKGEYNDRVKNGTDLDLFLIPNPDYKEPTTKSIQNTKPSVDWNAFRRVAAKDILCALITSDMGGAPEEKSRCAINAADELIKQLKEGAK